MNLRELVDHIRSGPALLVLGKPLRFRRRTRSNPCDFSDFLQVMQSSETIRTAVCQSHQELGIAEDEWVLLVKTLGSIKGIQNLCLICTHGSRDFHPFQALADAVKNAHSLYKLSVVVIGEAFPGDPSGLTALANALREHTALQEFAWLVGCSPMEAAQITALDPVFRTLVACPHLWKVTVMTNCASADAMKNLLQLQSATDLRLLLETENWLAVADEIRRGRCNVRFLDLAMFRVAESDATKAVKAVASAIRLDQNLEHITLQMVNGFTDEAGLALAEALTVNKTLRMITLCANVYSHVSARNNSTLGIHAYEALSAMLRVNPTLVLKLPPFETAGADERLCESHDRLRIEQRFNQVGRGRLLSSIQTSSEEWVGAMHELNSCDVDDSPAFQVSCLYKVLRSNPTLVCMS
jgi:hypothetical protein